MRIPKYIDKALKLRTKYAILLDKQSAIVDTWLDKQGVECSSEDTHGGVEIYINPLDSEKSIREYIETYSK